MNEQTILIVDDENSIRELLALYFRKEGFHVEEAADGAQALLGLEKFKPDLVLLDIMMPILDGLEVCQQIRKHSNTPVILLTAKGEDEDRILGLEIGADDYITKPFSVSYFRARIVNLLQQRKDLQRIYRENLIPTDQSDTSIADVA